jgi:hypothetical protein
MRRLIGVAAAAAMVGSIPAAATAQDVSHLNQDTDNRPNLQSEQTVSGDTSRAGLNVQQPEQTARSRSTRRRTMASKTLSHRPNALHSHPGAAR